MEQLINYKKKIASRFLPLEGEEALKELPDSEEFVYAEKLDGHLGFAVVEKNKVAFYNRSGTLLDLPDLAAAFPKVQGIWAGELYIQQERSRSFLVATALVNAKKDISFAVFDAVHALDKPLADRMKMVEEFIPAGPSIHPVKWIKSTSKKEIQQVYADTVAKGKEGLVVHPQHGISYKLKPIIELDLTVLGYCLKEDGSGLRSLLVGVKDDDKWLVVASVGGGFKDEDRASWIGTLEPLATTGDIVLVAKNKLAYKWVKPSIVVQVKCLEIIGEDASGNIRKEALTYTDEKGYQAQQKMPGVSLVSPVFQGVRTDKKPGTEDTGINQIADRIEVTKAEWDDINDAAQPEVLFRKVYTKTGKNGTAIRKFVGVKTNKKQTFPDFYLFYTDFSAGRKDPLKTEINISGSSEILNNQLEKLIEENIKKGWVLTKE